MLMGKKSIALSFIVFVLLSTTLVHAASTKLDYAKAAKTKVLQIQTEWLAGHCWYKTSPNAKLQHTINMLNIAIGIIEGTVTYYPGMTPNDFLNEARMGLTYPPHPWIKGFKEAVTRLYSMYFHCGMTATEYNNYMNLADEAIALIDLALATP